MKGIQIEYIDVSPLPMINTDLEIGNKYPAPVEEFRQKILPAHAILFASPEYNYSVARQYFFQISNTVSVELNG